MQSEKGKEGAGGQKRMAETEGDRNRDGERQRLRESVGQSSGVPRSALDLKVGGQWSGAGSGAGR